MSSITPPFRCAWSRQAHQTVVRQAPRTRHCYPADLLLEAWPELWARLEHVLVLLDRPEAAVDAWTNRLAMLD